MWSGSAALRGWMFLRTLCTCPDERGRVLMVGGAPLCGGAGGLEAAVEGVQWCSGQQE
jgi:predicted nucleic acid-binding Zn finger protein